MARARVDRQKYDWRCTVSGLRLPAPESDTEDTSAAAYYAPIIGSIITAVHHGKESIWLHLSNGAALEIIALPCGFDFEIHT